MKTTTKRNRLRGKNAERRVSKFLNDKDIQAKRVGILGSEDVLTDKFAIEVKSRKTVVIDKWYQQAVKNAKSKKTPLLVIHLNNKSYKNDYVVLKMQDFVKLIKPSK